MTTCSGTWCSIGPTYRNVQSRCREDGGFFVAGLSPGGLARLDGCRCLYACCVILLRAALVGWMQVSLCLLCYTSTGRSGWMDAGVSVPVVLYFYGPLRLDGCRCLYACCVILLPAALVGWMQVSLCLFRYISTGRRSALLAGAFFGFGGCQRFSFSLSILGLASCRS